MSDPTVVPIDKGWLQKLINQAVTLKTALDNKNASDREIGVLLAMLFRHIATLQDL